MAIKFEKIEPGMTLYDVKKNTKGFPRNCKWHVWPVNIIKVDVENRKVFASWNSNTPKWISERNVTKYRKKYPK